MIYCPYTRGVTLMTRRRIVFLALFLAGLTAILLSALYLRYRRPVSVIKELAVCTADGSRAVVPDRPVRRAGA